jgi:hypothetical protein
MPFQSAWEWKEEPVPAQALKLARVVVAIVFVSPDILNAVAERHKDSLMI